MAPVSYYKLDSFSSPDPSLTPDLPSSTGYDTAPFRPVDTSPKPEHSGYLYNSSPQNASSVFETPKPDTSSFLPLKPNTTNHLGQKKIQKQKRWLRILQILTRVFTVLFTAIVFGIIVYITIEFQTTKGVIRGGRGPWPKDPKLWPTFMFLIASGITLLVSIAMLVFYCCCFERARTSWKLTLVNYVAHIGIWITVSFLYRYERNLHGKDNDLWGWACQNAATAIQTEFDGVVDFKTLCRAQSSSWKVSIAECVVKVAFAVGHYIIYRKTRADEKQKLADGLGNAFSGLAESVF